MSTLSLGGPTPQGKVDYNLVGEGHEDEALAQDLIKDAKFYQDAALD